MKKLKTKVLNCRNCQACMLACSLSHDGQCSPNLSRIQIVKEKKSYTFKINICRHCKNKACVDACTFGAIEEDDNDIAIIDQDACTQCGACKEECPFGAIHYDDNSGRYFKCDLCKDRSDGPVCTAMCPVGAIT